MMTHQRLPSLLLSALVVCFIACDKDAESTTPTTQPDAKAEAKRPEDVDPRVWDWLGKLEKRGETLKSYQAVLIYTRIQSLLEDRQTRRGTIKYLAGPPARFRIDFTSLSDNGIRRKRNEGYIFDGSWMVHVKPDEKVFLKYQIVPPNEKFDPMSIGQGPFVIPLGQKRDDVLRDFVVTIVDPPPPETQPSDTADEPANEADSTAENVDDGDEKAADAKTADDKKDAKPLPVQLHLVPRISKKRPADSFGFVGADLWFDPVSLLPVKLLTLDEDENESIVLLRKAIVDKLDPKKVAAQFDTTSPREGSGWRVEITPWRE